MFTLAHGITVVVCVLVPRLEFCHKYLIFGRWRKSVMGRS